MSTAVSQPKQYKQPSRKGKKAWRKNVDITVVESGLEQVREEITQGGVIAEKSDDALFALDLGGDDAIPRREKTLKPLKTDEILQARSVVPAVDSRKRPAAVTDGVIQKKVKRKDGVSFAQLQHLRRIAYGGASAAPAGVLSSSKITQPSFDPWGDDAVDHFKEKEEIVREKLDFVDKVQKPKPPPTLKRKPIALAVIGSVPAVRVPAAGISYNPEFDKWDQLLREEGDKEVELEKKRLAEEAEAERIQALIEAPDVEQDIESEEGDDDDEDEEDEEGATKEKKEAKRKTQAQRNRALRQKKLEQKREAEKKLKQQERELMLVKKYARDIKMQERLRMAKAIAKMSVVEDDEKNPKIMRKKRFGKVHMPRAPLELQLPDELADSLRTLKPEGNLLSDRFRSLRERGILESRSPVIYAKKAKKSLTEKWSYKDFK